MTEENTTYRLEKFEIFLISVPTLSKTVAYSVVVALLASLTVWLTDASGIRYGSVIGPVNAFVILLVPTIIGGEGVRILIPSYPRKWGYFLALVNQLLVTGALVLGAFIPFVEPTDVFWIGAGVIALNTLEVLIITTGFRELVRLLVALLPQTGVYMGIFFITNIPIQPQIESSLVFISAILLVIFSAAVSEGMVGVNIDVKGFDYSAALTQHEELNMGVGEEVRRPIQKIWIENRHKSSEFLVPYFHPGLMAKIGGGRMSRDITNELCEEGVGSFLKTPTSHKSDPTSPSIADDVLEAQPTPPEDNSGTASKLVKAEYEDMTFRSRSYDGGILVLFDSKRYDDVEYEVYENAHDKNSEILVDCHAHEASEPKNLKSGTVEAERFRSALNEVIKKVRDAEQSSYEAGFAQIPGEVPGFVLIESVDGEETIIIGFDGNNVSEDIRNLKSEMENSFDEVILLTTDTHASPFQIDDQPEKDDIREGIDVALEELSPASVKFSSTMSPTVKVFDDFYTKLIDSFNISARFFILSLGLIYVYLVAGILIV